MKQLTKNDMGWRCLSCGGFHQKGDADLKPCCKEYNVDEGLYIDMWVSVDSLYDVLKDFQMEMCREHCVIRELLKEAFGVILKEREDKA